MKHMIAHNSILDGWKWNGFCHIFKWLNTKFYWINKTIKHITPQSGNYKTLIDQVLLIFMISALIVIFSEKPFLNIRHSNQIIAPVIYLCME